MKRNVFLSAGTPCNQEQEQILELVRRGLKSSGLDPLQPKFSGKAPLLNVRETLDQCAGIVVVAYPRYLIEKGKEKPGCQAEKAIENAHLGTTWNHIESAIAYDRGFPIMVLRDQLVKAEGFLEQTYDWKVQTIDFNTDFLQTKNFENMIEEFSNQVEDFTHGKYRRFARQNVLAEKDPTIGSLMSNMSLESTLQILAFLVAMMSAAFAFGRYFS